MNTTFTELFTTQILLMIIPLIVIQLGLMIFALIKLSKEGVQNLTTLAWVLIIIFVNMIGPILYLTIGRKKDDYYEELD